MGLGVPGKIVQIDANPTGMAMGRVSFGGVLKEVCLAYVPEAQAGDYVVVHVGFAISCIDEAEAQEVFKFLAEMEELAELEIPQPDDLAAVHANGHQA
jgi:hydrogenase expression/formation protein HypC